MSDYMQVPVIQYHKIDSPARDIRVRGGFTPPSRFRKQMMLMKKRGFVFYTASELIENFLAYGTFPENGVALTLDDGWEDNYTNAFQILRDLNIPATIFLVASCIGSESEKAVAEGERPRPHLSREQILEMSEFGIEFGSHSVNHLLLDRLSPEDVKREVKESKHQIEEITRRPCKVFAYPAGFFSDIAKQAIKEAGYIAAFSTTYGPVDYTDLFALNRVEILRRDRFLFQFARKVESLRTRS
jgi:peptidoglycan/xylan/chitin deacetylase (PgdA/CDA1 family)